MAFTWGRAATPPPPPLSDPRPTPIQRVGQWTRPPAPSSGRRIRESQRPSPFGTPLQQTSDCFTSKTPRVTWGIQKMPPHPEPPNALYNRTGKGERPAPRGSYKGNGLPDTLVCLHACLVRGGCSPRRAAQMWSTWCARGGNTGGAARDCTGACGLQAALWSVQAGRAAGRGLSTGQMGDRGSRGPLSSLKGSGMIPPPISNSGGGGGRVHACPLGQALEPPWVQLLEWVWASYSLVIQDCRDGLVGL